MIGKTLGEFHVLERIGAGGMGEVYRARQASLDRDVALKVLPPSALTDDNARTRFRQEALALSRLNHPNICTIHHIGEAEGQTYLAMEYVEGQPLSDMVGESGLPAEAVLRYGIQIAEGLAHAHERGLVHRDLKSANVMVTSDGRVKVLDFGLAVLSSTNAADSAPTQLTVTGAVVGTPAYMAPEVIRGESADQRSDVWGLGVVLYEAVTGRRPFEGETPYALSSAILEKPVRPLPEPVPASLSSVILRCLVKQPGERYQTGGEVRAALEAGTQSGDAFTTKPVTPAARQRSMSTVVAVAVGLLLAATLLVFGFRDLVGRFAGTSVEPIRSLAVLPFTNLSGDPGQEYFVDGMTDALIGELAMLGDLKVIGRTSIMSYKDSGKTIPEIAAELDVDGIIEGTAVSEGNRVVLNARLIHATSEQNVWGERYDRDLRDVLSLQSEVARTIGRQIQAVLTPEATTRLEETSPVDPDSYQLTLEGRYYANQLSREDLERAIRYFDDAIALDPSYAAAYAGKAFAWANLSTFYVPPLEAMPRAKEAAARAIELDPGLSEAHTWLGYTYLFFDWDWANAEAEFSRALLLNPNSPEAHLGQVGYFVSRGEIDDAMIHLRRAQELDPLSLLPYASANGSQWTLLMGRRYDESIAEGRRALQLDPASSWAHANLGLALILSGEGVAGVAELEEAARLEDSPLLDAFLSYGYAESGREAEARQLIAEVEAVSRERYTCAYEIAVTHVALGDPDTAFEWLERAYRDRADCIPYLNVDPRLDPVRQDPRLRELIDRVGFETPTRASNVPSRTPRGLFARTD